MKSLHLLIIGFVCMLLSCKGGDPTLPYAYNANPRYTWGYIEYFGTEYSKFSPNNVFSISLFSDSLYTDSTQVLHGVGQYLFLEDVYVSPTDKLLPSGTYTINSSGLANTVFPGKNDTVGTEVFPIGATISYYEENTAKSKLKFITEGTFTVTKSVTKLITNYTITCDFKTDDKKVLKGSFTGTLGYADESLQLQRTASRKLIHSISHF
jgi:hypothetical protein